MYVCAAHQHRDANIWQENQMINKLNPLRETLKTIASCKNLEYREHSERDNVKDIHTRLLK